MNLARAGSSAAASTESINEAFYADVLSGLSASPKRLPSKYFYDDQGSKLFQAITAHPDYYPTRKELEIFQDIAPRLPEFFPGSSVEIVELGVGDGHKTRLLLEGFLAAGHKVQYVPIDISEEAMSLLAENLPTDSGLSVNGIVGDYIDALGALDKRENHQRLVLFLGSNIGNFDLASGTGFLHRVRAQLTAQDHLLIGFDMKKDISVLTRAYNDSAGYTREFNLNLLRRINRELDADFDIDAFDHVGIYNPTLGAMESYLIATQKQKVRVRALDAVFKFAAYEPIHTEYSFKYHQDDIERLCKRAGFRVVEHFTDTQRYFTDSLWQAV